MTFADKLVIVFSVTVTAAFAFISIAGSLGFEF